MTTEADMIRLLDRKYSTVSPGNGPKFVTADYVKLFPGFSGYRQSACNRTMDYFAMDLWPSSGLPMIGHEIKCARSDWLTEMKDPTKAAAWTRYLNKFYLVISEPKIALLSEIPEGWGLMILKDNKLYTRRGAVTNPDPEPLPKNTMACLLRATMQHGRAIGYREAMRTNGFLDSGRVGP